MQASQNLVGVRRIGTDGESELDGRQLRHRAQKISRPAAVAGQDGAQELRGFRDPPADDRLPGGFHPVAARDAHAAIGHAKSGCRHDERGGVSGRHLGHERALRCDPFARRSVERHQSVVEQRGVSRCEDRAGKPLRCRAAAKHDVHPDRGRQRERNRLGGGWRVGLLFAFEMRDQGAKRP
ncbi:MAG TPA: hypothetical protein VFN38_11750, partial [Gemmatimonadaceae bacterium]|nr:hypothetical protein [Gemmatimonadaceae bacterium]